MLTPQEQSNLLVRIDERQQQHIQAFKEHKTITERELKSLREDIQANAQTIRDAKVGAAVLTSLASLGALVVFQWESIKTFFKGA